MWRGVLALTFAVASQASARPPEGSSEAYARGEAQYQAGEFLAAAASFEEAYARERDPSILFNIAQAYRFGKACAKAADSYRRPTANSSNFLAPLHSGMLPSGSRIERIDLFVRDDSADVDVDIAVRLCRSWIDPDGTDPGGDCSIGGSSSGAPGDSVITVLPDYTIQYDGDPDNDGTDEVVNYVLAADFGLNGAPGFSSDLRLRGARILYRRQVSPAPAIATFNDVPTSHPFFQFVEALAASGITAGCGTGIYCPDSPLTRGQMAVFLAKALGLHWPATVLP